mmetsp:Transcript_81931/g.232247  ORF Transcript_81931/g.232247 Transcript_81931/m.232247 type:complete len:419 (+) Transcript_81931:108-1364(+)
MVALPEALARPSPLDPAPRDAAAAEDADLRAIVQALQQEKADLLDSNGRLERERTALQDRLDFVEELLGPTEAQRKVFQEQLTTARDAALRARRHGVAVPTRFVGRLDEDWLRRRGVGERDCALLQRGCVAGQNGVPRDVSLLGDPGFKPYDEVTRAPCWTARGGLLRLSLADVRSRWGEEVALEVMRCAMELDRHDASRRLGVQLPWHASEARELQPAEVIALMEREITAQDSAEKCFSDDSLLDSTGSVNGVGSIASPAWSVVDSILSTEELDFIGTVAIDASPTPTSPDMTWLSRYDSYEPHQTECNEWSLADADIEQLLQQNPGQKTKRARPHLPPAEARLGASASGATLQEGRSEEVSDEGECPDDAEVEDEVLLELLQRDGQSSAPSSLQHALAQLCAGPGADETGFTRASH